MKEEDGNGARVLGKRGRLVKNAELQQGPTKRPKGMDQGLSRLEVCRNLLASVQRSLGLSTLVSLNF